MHPLCLICPGLKNLSADRYTDSQHSFLTPKQPWGQQLEDMLQFPGWLGIGEVEASQGSPENPCPTLLWHTRTHSVEIGSRRFAHSLLLTQRELDARTVAQRSLNCKLGLGEIPDVYASGVFAAEGYLS